MYESTRLCKDAQVRRKVKLGIKNEGKLELRQMSCYLCICRSVNAARVRTDATSDLFIPASEWVGFISAPVRLTSAGRTEKADLSALQTPQERFRVCASRWYFFSSRHQTEGLTACFAGRNAFYCALLCVYCTFMWCIVCLVL